MKQPVTKLSFLLRKHSARDTIQTIYPQSTKQSDFPNFPFLLNQAPPRTPSTSASPHSGTAPALARYVMEPRIPTKSYKGMSELPTYEDLSKLIDEEYGVEGKSTLVKLCEPLNQIAHLEYFRGFLERCDVSPKHAFFAFKQMNAIIRFRGCTMNPEMLKQMLVFFIGWAGGKAENLLARPEVLNIVAENLAVTSRLLFESTRGDMTSVGEGLMRMMGSNTAVHQKVALKVMEEICEVFKENMRHLSLLQNQEVRKQFLDGKLPEFFNIVLGILRGTPEQEIFHGALSLMIRILKFFDTNSSDDRCVLRYPLAFGALYANSEILQKVFTGFQAPVMVDTVLELLYYIVSAPPFIWGSEENKMGFFNCVTGYLLGPMQSGLPLLLVSRLCFKIVHQLDKTFLGQENSRAFFEAVATLSKSVFTQADMEQDAMMYMLRLWNEFSNWAEKGDTTIVDLVAGMFQECVLTLLEQIKNEPQKWKGDIGQINPDVFRILWSLAEHCYGSACELIVGQIKARLSGSATTLLELALLVRMVAAKLKGGATGSAVASADKEQQTEQLFVAVIGLIDQTNQTADQVVKSLGPGELVFEDSLLEFMQYYQNHLGSRGVPKQVDERTKGIIQVFVKRLMILLTSGVCDAKTMNEAIMVIIQMIARISDALKGSEFMEQLQGFSLRINFDHLPDLSESKRPRTRLFVLYMKLIQNDAQLRQFLEGFDGKFKSISSEEQAFITYTELKGVFEGVAGDARKYTRLLEWFSRAHFSDTIGVIERFGSNPLVVKAVCRLWVSMFPDKVLSRDRRFSTNSGFGIKLFKASSGIIQAILNAKTPDVHKMVILFTVIRNCLTSEAVNFGVMEYYHDDSYKQLVGLFYDLLKPAVESDIMDVPKMAVQILKSIASITKVMGAAFFSDQGKVEFTREFLRRCLLHHRVAARNTSEDIWKYVWEALNEMLDVCSSVDALKSVFSLFEPHFVLIMDSIMNKQDDKYILDTCLIFMYQAIYNQEFVQRFIRDVCSAADPQWSEFVRDAFQGLHDAIHPPITKTSKQEFLSAAGKFSSTMRRYPCAIANLPSMASCFQ